MPRGRGRKAKAAEADPKKHNSASASGPTAEIRQHHHNMIQRAANAMDKSKKAYQSDQATYRSAIKAAKQDGMDPDAIKLARDWHYKNDHGELHQTLANAAQYLEDIKSPLGSSQLNLFENLLEAKSPAEMPYNQGLAAGKNGEPVTNCGFKPGSEEFVAWRDGWDAGQKTIQDTIGKSDAPAAVH